MLRDIPAHAFQAQGEPTSPDCLRPSPLTRDYPADNVCDCFFDAQAHLGWSKQPSPHHSSSRRFVQEWRDLEVEDKPLCNPMARPYTSGFSLSRGISAPLN